MKRIMALIIGALLITLWAIPVSAEEGIYETAQDWYAEWHEDLPEYVCGVWVKENVPGLFIGIQNNAMGEIGMFEILNLIEDDLSVVGFQYQKYSYNYLTEIRQELCEYVEKDVGLHSLAIDCVYNCVVLGFYSESKNDPETVYTVEKMINQYGDAVEIRYEYPLMSVTTMLEPNLTGGDGIPDSEPVEEYDTAEQWYADWYESPPLGVCGMWFENTSERILTVGISDDPLGEAVKQKILDQIYDDETVRFVYQTYSRFCLVSIIERISQEAGEYYISALIDDEENCVVVMLDEDYKNTPEMQRLIDTFINTYGDAIQIEFSESPNFHSPPAVGPNEGAPNDVDSPQMGGNDDIASGDQGQTGMVAYEQTDVIATEMSNPVNNPGVAMFIVAVVFVYVMAAAVTTVKKKKALVMRQTNFGTTVVESYPISTGSVKKMVKSSHPQISPELDEKVFEAINAANREDKV